MSSTTALIVSASRSTFRDRSSLVFSFVFPSVLLIAFGLFFSGMQQAGGKSYMSILAPGLIAYSVGYTAVFAGANNLIVWRNNGILKILKASPVSRASVVGSRLVTAFIMGLVQTALLVILSLVPWFHLDLVETWPLIFLSALLGVVAFFSIGVVISNVVRTTEALAAILNAFFIPMSVFSGVFFPASLAPQWFQTVSYLIPLRYFANLNGHVFVANGSSTDLYLDIIVLGAIAVALFSIASRTLRWTDE